MSVTGVHERLAEFSRTIIGLEPQNDWYAFYAGQHTARMASDIDLVAGALPPPARVLDVGCNPPWTLATLLALGYDATGIDVNPDSFTASRQKLQLPVVKTDIEREVLPFPDASFDVVMFCEVFEHLRINPVFTVSQIHRVLRPGGFLYLSTPNLFSLAGIRNFLLRRSAYSWSADDLYSELNRVNEMGFAGHVREYTHREVEGFLTRSGFSRIEPFFRLGGTKGWTRPLYAVAPFLRPNVAFRAWR